MNKGIEHHSIHSLKFISIDSAGIRFECNLNKIQVMTDNLKKEQRSYIMSKIKGKNTKPELLVRRFLFAKDFRFRIHDKRYPGKPDIVLPKYKTVIFVNGCFWHGHQEGNCFALPKSNVDFWNAKITGNIKKDILNQIKLKELGFKVIVVWECQLKESDALENLVLKIKA